MLFLGMNQRARQLTVSLRDQNDDVPSSPGLDSAGEDPRLLRSTRQVLGDIPDEVVKPIRDSIEVKSYVGGLVKSFERKAA